MATLTSNESDARSLKPRKHETCSSLATDQGTIPPWLLFPTSLDHHKSSFVSGPALLRQLDASKNEIRLIHILPKLSSSSTSRVTEPIQCILSHVSLDDKPYCHSLLYTWEDETLGESFEDPDHPGSQIPIDSFVFLEGERITVTPNLWAAI
jgi:hypothetical protein